MRHIVVAFVMLFASLVAALADDEYTLNFQKGHNLKLIYDAGLRPWKTTNSTCMVGGNGMKDITHWKIILPDSDSFDYSSNMASFEVLEDFDLARIDFSGVDDMPIQDAAAMTKAICLAMKIPTTGLSDYVASLDEHAKFNEHTPEQSKGWGQRTELNDIRFNVALVMRPFMDHTSAQVNITIEWRDYLPKDWWKAPLKKSIADLRPPPGYEGVSMAPPPRDPNQKGFPAHDLDYYEKKIDEFKKQQIAAGNVTAAQLTPQPPIVIPPVPGADYIAGQDYTYELPHKVSAWANSGEELADYDSKVRCLLQTDKELKSLKDLQTKQLTQAASPQAGWLLPGSIVRLDHSISTLDVVLVETYKEAERKQWFKDHPNPTLLKEMLCHYYLYVNSQDARWPAIIDSLSKIDPAVNAEALKEVKAYRDANPK
jgi:hypothetical protein